MNEFPSWLTFKDHSETEEQLTGRVHTYSQAMSRMTSIHKTEMNIQIPL